MRVAHDHNVQFLTAVFSFFFYCYFYTNFENNTRIVEIAIVAHHWQRHSRKVEIAMNSWNWPGPG
jgi:hypothetical protein